MTRQHHLATAEKSLTLLWVPHPPLKLEIFCRKQMHMPKCLKNKQLPPFCDYGVNILPCNSEKMPTSFLWKNIWGPNGCEGSFWERREVWQIILVLRVQTQGETGFFFSSLKKDDWLKYYQESQEVYSYSHSLRVFAALQNIIQCFRGYVTFIPYST